MWVEPSETSEAHFRTWPTTVPKWNWLWWRREIKRERKKTVELFKTVSVVGPQTCLTHTCLTLGEVSNLKKFQIDPFTSLLLIFVHSASFIHSFTIDRQLHQQQTVWGHLTPVQIGLHDHHHPHHSLAAHHIHRTRIQHWSIFHRHVPNCHCLEKY